MLNVACMQKIKIGHRAKFRDKDKCFLQLLFPVRAILRCISTSGVVRARLLIEILTNFAHAYILVMAWMGYARARLKTLSSLLKLFLEGIDFPTSFPGSSLFLPSRKDPGYLWSRGTLLHSSLQRGWVI